MSEGLANRPPRPFARTLLSITDQGIYSLTNLALTILVARVCTPEAFGAFSLGFALYIIVSGTVRGFCAETFVIRYTSSAQVAHKEAERGVLGVVLLISAALGALLVAASIPISGVAGTTFLLFGLCLPGLMTQDTLRYICLARGVPQLSVLNDLIYAVLQAATSVVLLVLHNHNPSLFFIAWGATAYICCFVMHPVLRTYPSAQAGRCWYSRNRDMSFRLAADDFLGVSAAQIAGLVLAATAGLASAGALRAGQTLFGPLLVVNSGVTAALTPELIRVKQRNPQKVAHRTAQISIGLATLAIAWGVGSLALPADIGRELFGTTWDTARSLLLPLLVSQIAYGVRVGPTAGIRAFGNAQASLVGRAWSTLASLAMPVVGALAYGRGGAVWGLAGASTLQLLIWYRQFRDARGAYSNRNSLDR